MKLKELKGVYAVCKLPQDAPVPDWAVSEFLSITRTNRELSLVLNSEIIPDDIESEGGWKLFRFDDQLDFSMTGVIANLSGKLADASISIFVVSTYDTDYVMVKQECFTRARLLLEKAGYEFVVDQTL